MAPRTITLEHAAGVAWLTLDRPDDANAISLELASELRSAAESLADDGDLRVVVISGRGRFFCAGGDLKSFAGSGRPLPEHLAAVVSELHPAIEALQAIPVPVIAAVNGPAAGAGFSLVCACDLAIAADSATFVSAYTRLGFTPDGSLTWFLPRLVGQRRALELIITNRRLDAAEAATLGIVNRVVPDDELSTAVAELASAIAHGPRLAHEGVKALLAASRASPLAAHLGRETEWLVRTSGSPDGREGLAAFVEKRTPEFD